MPRHQPKKNMANRSSFVKHLWPLELRLLEAEYRNSKLQVELDTLECHRSISELEVLCKEEKLVEKINDNNELLKCRNRLEDKLEDTQMQVEYVQNQKTEAQKSFEEREVEWSKVKKALEDQINNLQEKVANAESLCQEKQEEIKQLQIAFEDEKKKIDTERKSFEDEKVEESKLFKEKEQESYKHKQEFEDKLRNWEERHAVVLKEMKQMKVTEEQRKKRNKQKGIQATVDKVDAATCTSSEMTPVGHVSLDVAVQTDSTELPSCIKRKDDVCPQQPVLFGTAKLQTAIQQRENVSSQQPVPCDTTELKSNDQQDNESSQQRLPCDTVELKSNNQQDNESSQQPVPCITDELKSDNQQDNESSQQPVPCDTTELKSNDQQDNESVQQPVPCITDELKSNNQQDNESSQQPVPCGTAELRTGSQMKYNITSQQLAFLRNITESQSSRERKINDSRKQPVALRELSIRTKKINPRDHNLLVIPSVEQANTTNKSIRTQDKRSKSQERKPRRKPDGENNNLVKKKQATECDNTVISNVNMSTVLNGTRKRKLFNPNENSLATISFVSQDSNTTFANTTLSKSRFNIQFMKSFIAPKLKKKTP